MKNNIICAICSAIVMIFLPWIAVTFVKGDSGMAVCFLLFIAINPLFSAAAGIFAGKNPESAWFQPIITAAMFLCGTWLFFDMKETAFLLYGAGYLIIGFAAMIITSIIIKQNKSKHSK